MKDTDKTPLLKCTVLIFLCFLLTSTGWLSWEYHLMDQVAPGVSDICTMVIGYLLQAAGISVFALLLRYRKSMAERILPAALLLHLVFMIPAVLSPYLPGTLVFGFLMNLFCGIIAGYYLYDLTRNVQADRKASVFGVGYALAILGSWLLSKVGGGALYYSDKVLIICAVLTIAAIAAGRRSRPETEDGEKPAASKAPAKQHDRSFLLLAGALVLLFSIVNSSGFAFPAADLGRAVNVEFSRLVYAAGLVMAGFVTDKSRKYGAVAALTALMIPFIILALRGETVSAVIFWALSYFTFGFYSVYRIILFSDIAAEKDLLFLSGFGLLLGRVGDAAGEAICISLGNRLLILVCVTAVLFAVTVAVFFKVYHRLYMPEARKEQSEKEKFYQYAMQHDLSARERDMLRLLLEEKSNAEIADALCISENTVKFHIRNLLQKTGCRNRNDLLASYLGSFPA